MPVASPVIHLTRSEHTKQGKEEKKREEKKDAKKITVYQNNHGTNLPWNLSNANPSHEV
jgi:hypothetical protein